MPIYMDMVKGPAPTSGGGPQADSSSSNNNSRSRCADCATRELCLIGSLPQAHAGIGPLVRERSFHAGEMLSREGDMASHFKIVKIGSIFLCRNSAGGPARPIAISGRGSTFGIFSYLSVPNQLSVVAGSSGRYCEIAADRVQSLARNDSAFRARLEKIYVDTVSVLANWAEAIGRSSVLARVAASLLLLADSQRSASITIPSHTALAKMLGTTRESVARALATLEASAGLLRKSPRRCEIFPESLRARLAGTR